MSGTIRFPIHVAKIQSPPLREQTLQRDRLLDWLRAKIHHRAVFVVAEAGYGKTTLLADYARRTRTRTLWYRLDEDDRDPIAFVNYLVATFQGVDPAFAPATAQLLREIADRGISHDALVGTFVHELGAIGAEPTVLIVDDYHLVDDAPEVRSIIRRILDHAPERFTVVLLSRRRPQLPVARLRSLGELAELGAEDLRFRPDETERLFRESYGRPLEADVLEELDRRTEGWAASLQLVESAIRDRSPGETRSFVRSLSGTQAELYDYLAEEVVGDLDPDLQRFLMRTAVLQSVDPALATVVTGLDDGAVRRFIEMGERLGLLGRQGRSRWSHRYHPLVQGFLVDRLARDAGRESVRDLHRTVARHATGQDWRLAAHHWAAAEEAGEVHAVIADSIAGIMGTGEFGLAESYLERFPPRAREAAFEVFLSRLDFYRNRITQAIERARWAAEHIDPGAIDAALANQMALELNAGAIAEALGTARRLRSTSADPLYTEIAEGLELGIQASLDGSLEDAERKLEALARVHAERDLQHFLGITLNNLVSLELARGRPTQAIGLADRARAALEGSSAGPELAGLLAMQGLAYLQIGDVGAGAACFEQARHENQLLSKAEALIAEAEGEVWYGSSARAERLLSEAQGFATTPELRHEWIICRISLLTRTHRYEEARRVLGSIDLSAMSVRPGEKARRLGIVAQLGLGAGDSNGLARAHDAYELARSQSAGYWEQFARALLVAYGATDFSEGVLTFKDDPSYLSMVAEAIVARLVDLNTDALQLVHQEAERRADRWREALRTALEVPDPHLQLAAARLLDEVGDRDDVARLRSLARSLRSRGDAQLLGRRLAKLLAPKAFIEDLGRMAIHIGPRRIAGTDVRRRALTLLGFLLSRPSFAVPREQVLDALWPDLEPDDAQNSLNQTLYFLRRVFDPAFDEDTSPAYVRLESDLLWLDGDLVDSRSAICWRLLRESASLEPGETADALIAAYTGRFAMDFAYEEWAAGYRGSLHAAYLDAIERAIKHDLAAGRHSHALALARAVLEVDPDADHVELSLLRIYRSTGAYAAAAEQYGHYAGVLRTEFDEEPPPLESI